MIRTSAVCDKKRRGFMRSERGSMTAMALYILIPVLMLAGYAIDTGHVISERTHLQIAADTAAHAALLKRELNSESNAKVAALDLAERNLPALQYGYVISEQDIEFGQWDHTTRVFTPVSGARGAVRVVARRIELNENAVKTYLLKLVGIDEWNISSTSVFTTYYPTCLREGFVAESIVDLQSNNSFSNGFCIHSNAHVSLNSNNYFEPGTIVSMANLDDIELPNSGYKTNTGLQDALREGSWNVRILSRIQPLIAGLLSFDDRYRPAYITAMGIVTLPNKKVVQTDLILGRVHRFTCVGNGDLTIDNNVLVSRVVIVTNCDVKFGNGVVLEDAVIATTSTGASSITGTAGLQIGRNDSCAPGGSAQLVTMGSMRFPADLKIYGSQLIARDDIYFSANAIGIQGAALVAGGEISGTSNMNMGFCGTGMEANFQAAYFKLVM